MSSQNLFARIILQLQDDASRGLASARGHLDGITQDVNRLKQMVVGFFGLFAIKTGVEKIVELSDAFANLTARLKLSASSEAEFAQAQKETFAIAQLTRTGLTEVVNLYAKVEAAVKKLGGMQKDSVDITRAVSQAFKISGASASEAAGGILQFTQGLGSGRLAGDELKSVLENGQRLAIALADGLGVSVGQLRDMGAAGELTTEAVTKALLSQKDKLAAEYAQLPQTVAGAWVQLENQFLKYIGTSKEAKAGTQALAEGIGYVTQHLDGFVKTATLAGKAVVGAFAVSRFKGLLAWAGHLITVRNELRLTDIATAQTAANATRAAAATATGVAAGAAAASAAIASGAQAAQVAVTAASAAGTAASRAAILAGSTVAEASAIAGAAASNAAVAAGATITQAAKAAGTAASAAATAFGASATAASAAAAKASKAARAEALLAAQATAAATNVTREAAREAASARVADSLAAQRSIAVAREEAVAKMTVANATIRTTEATIASLSAMAQSAEVTNLLAVEADNLTVAQRQLSAAQSDLVALRQREVAINAELAASREALVLAMEAEAGAAVRLAETATLAGGAMGALGRAGKSAMALVGGPLGVAVLGLWALYEVLQKVTGSEEKAAEKAKGHADALALMNAEVAKLSGAEVDIDFIRTKANIEAVNEKIKVLESFSFNKLFNVNNVLAQRDNLFQTLDTLNQRLESLSKKKIDDIINFDGSKLSTEQLNAALNDTKEKIGEIKGVIGPLQEQFDKGLIGEKKITEEKALLSAYEQRLAAIAKLLGGDVTQSVNDIKDGFTSVSDAAEKMAHGIDTAFEKTRHDAIAMATSLVEGAKDSAGKLHRPYDEAAKAITASFEQQAGRVDAALRQRLTAIELLTAVEKDKLIASTQAFTDAEFEKTTAALNTKIQLDQTWELTYGKAIELARTAGADISALEQQGAEARIGSLQTVVNAYQSSVDRMVDEEFRLLAAARHTVEERENLSRSLEDKIRALQQKGMGGAQAYADQQKQIDEKQAAAKQALLDGNFTGAKRFAEEAIRLAESTAHAVENVSKDGQGKTQRQEVVSENRAISTSIDQIKESGLLADAALVGLNNTQLAQARTVSESLRQAQSGLAEFKAGLDKAVGEANTKAQLKLTLDTEAAKGEIDKLAALAKAKELAVIIKADPINADQAIAELKATLKNADIKVPAVIAFNELRDEQLKNIQAELYKGISILSTFPMDVNTQPVMDKLVAMKADIDAKLEAPTNADHKVNPHFGDVLDLISVISQPTHSTHTVYVNEVRNHAGGGAIQGLATGGPVAGQSFRRANGYIRGPGTTTSDEVPIMASDKEFMQPADAVDYYSLEYMEDLRHKRAPKPYGYAGGGQIGNSSAPARAADRPSYPGRDIIDLNFNFSGKTLTLQAPRDTARELAVQLRNLARAS